MPPHRLACRPLGRTGVSLPVLGLGTWRTFDVARPEDRLPVTNAALDAGVRVFDSSPMYGRAEEVLADTLGPRRSEAFVATKVWTPDLGEGRAQVDRALRLYGGRVDLYQVHNLLAWDRHLPFLEQRRRQGHVGWLGVTHYDPRAFGQLLRAMRSGRFHAVQIPYNPLQREAEVELLPAAAELGLGVLVMRPFAEGALLRRTPPAEELAPLAVHGVTTWAEALLRWVLADPRVTTVLAATSRPDHVAANAAAARDGLPPLPPDAREHVATLAKRYCR